MRTQLRTMIHFTVLSAVILSLSVGCATTTYWATVSGYKVQSQNQESGQSELELRVDSVVKTSGYPLTLVVKNTSGKVVEIVKTKIVLTVNDTLIYADPLLSGAVTDQIILAASSRQVTESNSVVGNPRYKLYDPYYSTSVYGQSSTISSQSTETSGYIQKHGEILTLYPNNIAKVPLCDAFLWWATNTKVMAPKDEDDPPTVPFYANAGQRYGDDDIVRLGIPILIKAMRQVAARVWRIHVAYRLSGSDEIKVATIVYTPGEPGYVQHRYSNQD